MSLKKNTSGKRNNILPDTYAEIDLSALRNNFEAVKSAVNKRKNSNVKICSVVKADGYGHGMNEIGKYLSEAGTDYLATADYYESIILSDHLKKHSDKNTPVLCMGLLNDEKIAVKVLKRNIEVSIADINSAVMLNDLAGKMNLKVNIQAQIDTGINRTGFKLADAYDAIKTIASLKNLNLKGIYSHFATSEIPGNSYSKKQLADFKKLISEAEHNIIKFDLKHISNTGGIINFCDPYFNMVRPGISLYGYYPDRKKIVNEIGLIPVMTLKSKVKFIKTLDKNQSISYDRTYYTKKRTQVISIPVGYGDGYSRLLSNKAKVMVNGKFRTVTGKVCMDWIMSDVGTDSGICENDEVILFGSEYPAYKLSDIMNTIPYEVICGITKRVKRIYTEN
ncbi:MAG TPA: alanine racemase [Ignavibacteria bacterium]|nr:alanine racemase [Ignavibacteria bacterium]HMR39822.1 alanine racemase [Ignavibacteria bacterium]